MIETYEVLVKYREAGAPHLRGAATKSGRTAGASRGVTADAREQARIHRSTAQIQDKAIKAHLAGERDISREVQRRGRYALAASRRELSQQRQAMSSLAKYAESANARYVRETSRMDQVAHAERARLVESQHQRNTAGERQIRDLRLRDSHREFSDRGQRARHSHQEQLRFQRSQHLEALRFQRIQGAARRRLIGGAGGGVSRFGGGMLAMAGAYTGAVATRQATTWLSDLQSLYQQQQFGLGVMMQHSGFVQGWEKASSYAAQMREDMRIMSMTRPGTLDDWMRVASDIMSVMEGTGASIGQVKQLTERAVAAETIFGLREGTVGFDIRQLMMGQGNARMIQTPFLRTNAAAIAALARGDARSLKKMGRDDLSGVAAAGGGRDRAREMITQSLYVDPKALSDYGKSWPAQLESIQSNIREMGRMAGLPVFQIITQELQKWNHWFISNKEEVKRIATEIGTRLIGVVRSVASGVMWIYNNWGMVKRIVQLFIYSILLVKFAGAINTLRLAIYGPAGMSAAFIQAGATGQAAMRGVEFAGITAAARIKSAFAGIIRFAGWMAMLDAGIAISRGLSSDSWIGRYEAVKSSMLGSGVMALTDAVGITHVKRKKRIFDMVGGIVTRAKDMYSTQFNNEQQRRLIDDLRASTANQDVKVNIDQRGSKFEWKPDLRGEDVDQVFVNMQRGVARASLSFVASPYAPG